MFFDSLIAYVCSVLPEVVANPILEQLAVALLGEPDELFLAFFNGNTNIPGSGTQLLCVQ